MILKVCINVYKALPIGMLIFMCAVTLNYIIILLLQWVQKVEKGQKDFETISANVRKEIARFDRLRVNDFKTNVIKYLEVLMEKQQQVWNRFTG